MELVTFSRWQLRSDPDQTRRAYAQVPTGKAEACKCGSCRNFIMGRNLAYPKEALILLRRLGISVHHEAELWHVRLPSGAHFYRGWFPLVGEILGGGTSSTGLEDDLNQFDLECLSQQFAMGFNNDAVALWKPFEGLPIVHLEFETRIPWVLEEPEEAYLNEPRLEFVQPNDISIGPSEPVPEMVLQQEAKPVVPFDGSQAPLSALASRNQNERRYVRVRTRLAACIRHAELGDEVGATEDVSRGGFRFRSPKHYPPGSLIEVAVPYLPTGSNIFSRARIVRALGLPSDLRIEYGVAYVTAHSGPP
jgi:hypothetical protein